MLELFENVDLELSWTDNVTHLILKTDNKGHLCRTKKYFWGILSNCYIVNLEWVKKCIDTKCLQHEVIHSLMFKTICFDVLWFVLVRIYAT